MAGNESPADKITGATVRMNHVSRETSARYQSGRKYRLVVKRKSPAAIEAEKAQAASLREAAAQGAPFCQKCEKARAAQSDAGPASAPTPAPEPERFSVAPEAAEAQAAALGGAARSGAAFCAKC